MKNDFQSEGGRVFHMSPGSSYFEYVEHYHQSDHHYYDLSSHPLARYVMRPQKAEELIEWMRHVINALNTPKEQLALLKAALESNPRAILPTVTVEAFNAEFKLEISADTFRNWIRNARGMDFEEEDLSHYKAEIERIMNKS